MIVAVAERAHWPNTSMNVIRWYADRWACEPLHMMLTIRALTGGPCRTRLMRAMGGEGRIDFAVNLLAPAKKTGCWDAEDAILSAASIRGWARAHGHALVALGRRVASVLAWPETRPGEVADVGGLPVLALPHPSGSNRYLNDPENRAACRRWIEEFHERTLSEVRCP